MKKESKAELTDRLRASGQWEAACKIRDETRARLLAEGKNRREANDGAWDAVRSAFPRPEPASRETPEVAGEDLDILPEDFDKSSPDLPRDILWTYANLDNRNAKPSDAPGPGAWSLLKWARDHRNRFFEYLLPKAMGTRTEDIIQQEEKIDAEEEKIEQLTEMLEQSRREIEEEELKESRRIDCPACAARLLLPRPKRNAAGTIEYPAPRVSSTDNSRKGDSP